MEILQDCPCIFTTQEKMNRLRKEIKNTLQWQQPKINMKSWNNVKKGMGMLEDTSK